MIIFWSYISPYFFPVICSYFFSGVYYIVCDVSKVKADRPAYLANPKTVTIIGVFWSLLIINNMWRYWHQVGKYSFIAYIKGRVVPQIAVFLVLAIDFFYAFRNFDLI
jgi:hypothetical protein